MSNQLTSMERSAVPDRVKRCTHTQEVIRRLRNTSREMDWNIKADIISHFSYSLMISGYSERYREEIILAGLKGFEKQCIRSDKGEIPLHRPRSFNRKERVKKKAMAKTSWYKPSDSVIFVPTTPGSTLARWYKDILDKELSPINIKVKVVETSGQPLSRYLFKTNTSECLIPDCPVCNSGVPGASHSRSGAEYRATCLKCKEKGKVTSYEGESGSNAAYRLSQHVSDIKKQTQKWALSKHLMDMHPENSRDHTTFEFQCIRTFQKPLERQCFEGVLINRSKADIRLNSRAEFHQPSEIRIVTTRNSQETMTQSQRRNTGE